MAPSCSHAFQCQLEEFEMGETETRDPTIRCKIARARHGTPRCRSWIAGCRRRFDAGRGVRLSVSPAVWFDCGTAVRANTMEAGFFHPARHRHNNSQHTTHHPKPPGIARAGTQSIPSRDVQEAEPEHRAPHGARGHVPDRLPRRS